MSGNIRGNIDCYYDFNDRNYNASCLFTTIYNFFYNHPNYTLISLQYGTAASIVVGTVAGNGFPDTSATWGTNAFFVFRANATVARPYDVYHLFQTQGTSSWNTFGNSPGNPGLFNGSSNYQGGDNVLMGHATCIGVDGTGYSTLSPNNGNPWRGGTAKAGADAKGSPVWGAPVGGGTGYMCWPRSNNAGGSHQTLSQNTGGFYATPWPKPRFSIIGDDDSFVMLIDVNDSNNVSQTMSYSGLYVPRNDMTIAYPYCVIDTPNGLYWSTTNASPYGDVTGTSAQQGGVVMPLSASVRPAQLDRLENAFLSSVAFHPDKSLTYANSVALFNEFQIQIGVYETSPANACGYLGSIDFIRECYNIQVPSVNTDYSRLYYGYTNPAGSIGLVADRRYSVPWDSGGKTVPRMNFTKTGVSFVRAP